MPAYHTIETRLAQWKAAIIYIHKNIALVVGNDGSMVTHKLTP